VVVVLGALGLLGRDAGAGEQLLAAGVGLAVGVFIVGVWRRFRSLPDWAACSGVPARTRFFSTFGAASSASLAALAVGALLLAVCARRGYLRVMEAIGLPEVGRIQFILQAAVAFLLCTLFWYLFRALMELRDWARHALGVALATAAGLALVTIVIDTIYAAEALRNRGLSAMAFAVGFVAAGALGWSSVVLRGREVETHFVEHEP
jgi:hypothetical protein